MKLPNSSKQIISSSNFRMTATKFITLSTIVASYGMFGDPAKASIAVSAFSPAGVSTSPPSLAHPISTKESGKNIRLPGSIRFKRAPGSALSAPKPRPTSTSSLAMFSNPFDTNNGSKPIIFGAFLLAVVIAIQCLCVVDAGEIGVASTFGSLERYDPGLHFRNPLITSLKYLSTKTELLEQSNFVPTKEGLTVELDTAVLVRLDPDRAVDLFRTVGPDFKRKLVTPEASSSVRGLTSESEAKALYTAGRSELQNRLKGELTEKLGPRGIVVEDVLLKNVVLPEDLSQSIQEKARAEQESARMEFVLLKETQEAKRKAIQAEGIAEFQRIVTKGITPDLLQWKGIEATEKLAESPNSKIVIMGNSKSSLPVILGGENK